MIKIQYPYEEKSKSIIKDAFEKEYCDLLLASTDIIETNKILEKISFLNSKTSTVENLTIERLLTLSFGELIEIEDSIESQLIPKIKSDLLAKHNLEKIFIEQYFKTRKTDKKFKVLKINSSLRKEIFKNLSIIKKKKTTTKSIYSNLQNKIAAFFMSYSLLFNKKTCYYCNIDFINTISKNGKNFNHFTLDHFLPQADFPYFSLCLYNFVPSCYSCNAKFKKDKKFTFNDNLKFLSPSSSEYKLNSDFGFKLLFNAKGATDADKFHNIKNLTDFDIVIGNLGPTAEFNNFVDMFKLDGRYLFHKNEALTMILKRQIYSDSELIEIEKTLNHFRDLDSIKKDIFGSAIFDDEEKNEPLTRYKREIAKQLGLL